MNSRKIFADFVLVGILFISVFVSLNSCQDNIVLKQTSSLVSFAKQFSKKNRTIYENTVYYKEQILPILTKNCSQGGCHSSSDKVEGIILDSYSQIIVTGEVHGGNPEESLLYESISASDQDYRMPPKEEKQLGQSEINLI